MKKIISTILLISVLSISAVFAADKGALTVPVAAKCPVCGMFVAKYPDWTSTIRFKDGTNSY